MVTVARVRSESRSLLVKDAIQVRSTDEPEVAQLEHQPLPQGGVFAVIALDMSLLGDTELGHVLHPGVEQVSTRASSLGVEDEIGDDDLVERDQVPWLVRRRKEIRVAVIAEPDRQ